MQYFKKITDRETGKDYMISIGEHLTFTEAADKFEISQKLFRELLVELNVCQKKYDEKAGNYRTRLLPEAAEKGLGFRIDQGQHNTKDGKYYPFDVLSLFGQEYVEPEVRALLFKRSPEAYQGAFNDLVSYEESRKEKRMTSLTTQMRVCWLEDHYGDIPKDVVEGFLGVSKRVIYKFTQIRTSQLEKSKRQLEGRNSDVSDFKTYGFLAA